MGSSSKEKSVKDKSSKDKSAKDKHVEKKSKSLKKEKEKEKEKERKKDKKSSKKDKVEKRNKSKESKKKRRESTDTASSDSETSESGSDIKLDKLSLHNKSDTDSDTDSDDDAGVCKETMRLDRENEQAALRLQDMETGLQDYVATNLDLVRYLQTHDQVSADERVRGKFKAVYMDYVTTGFGADLDCLRKEHEIDDEGLEMLIDVLETGMLSFTPADQKMIIEEGT